MPGISIFLGIFCELLVYYKGTLMMLIIFCCIFSLMLLCCKLGIGENYALFGVTNSGFNKLSVFIFCYNGLSVFVCCSN